MHLISSLSPLILPYRQTTLRKWQPTLASIRRIKRTSRCQKVQSQMPTKGTCRLSPVRHPSLEGQALSQTCFFRAYHRLSTRGPTSRSRTTLSSIQIPDPLEKVNSAKRWTNVLSTTLPTEQLSRLRSHPRSLSRISYRLRQSSFRMLNSLLDRVVPRNLSGSDKAPSWTAISLPTRWWQ